MEGFFTLMLVWFIVYLGTRDSRKSHNHSMSDYEKQRIRESNRRFWKKEKEDSKRFKDLLYDTFWGSNKTL